MNFGTLKSKVTYFSNIKQVSNTVPLILKSVHAQGHYAFIPQHI